MLSRNDVRTSEYKIAYAEATKVKQKGVQSCLVALQKGANTSDVTAYKIARVYVAIEDNDDAFCWLDRVR